MSFLTRLRPHLERLDDDEFNLFIQDLNLYIKQRRRRTNAEMSANLEAGDRVVLTNIKPKYLIGHRGIVIDFEGIWVRVLLDRKPSARYSQNIRVKPACLRKVEN